MLILALIITIMIIIILTLRAYYLFIYRDLTHINFTTIESHSEYIKRKLDKAEIDQTKIPAECIYELIDLYAQKEGYSKEEILSNVLALLKKVTKNNDSEDLHSLPDGIIKILKKYDLTSKKLNNE